MSPIAPVLEALSAEIAALTGQLGQRVEVAGLGVTDRQSQLALGPPGLVSPNGACRLIQAADGWMALNLARADDNDLLPAWLGLPFGAVDPLVLDAAMRAHRCAELVEGAALLGLPAAEVGEVGQAQLQAELIRCAGGRSARDRLKVVDLSALWAGPLCGAVLAAMGAEVTRVESPSRPDPTRTATPEFHRRLNGAKAELGLNLLDPADRARLAERVDRADVLITSARPRAFAGLGLEPDVVFAGNPGLTWVAITGYGLADERMRVAFGDDAAAAGGLVRWQIDGAPRFLGDALADPVTGLAAAVGALKGVEAGGGVMVDAALARSAAGAAAALRQERAA